MNQHAKCLAVIQYALARRTYAGSHDRFDIKAGQEMSNDGMGAEPMDSQGGSAGTTGRMVLTDIHIYSISISDTYVK